MLFHVTHTHTEHTCPINDQGVMGETFGKVFSSLTESGVDVVGWWDDPPAHQMFFVLDANSVRPSTTDYIPSLIRGQPVLSPWQMRRQRFKPLWGTTDTRSNPRRPESADLRGWHFAPSPRTPPPLRGWKVRHEPQIRAIEIDHASRCMNLSNLFL